MGQANTLFGQKDMAIGIFLINTESRNEKTINILWAKAVKIYRKSIKNKGFLDTGLLAGVKVIILTEVGN